MSRTGATTTQFDKDSNLNNQLAYKEQMTYTDGVSKTVTARSWFDGGGRVLRSGVGQGVSPASYDAVKAVYDSLGRVLKQSNPYAGNSSGDGSPQYWTTNEYDALWRATKVTLPDGQTIQTLYNGDEVTVTDQVGRQHRSQVDGLGRLIAVTEQDVASGSLTVGTSYSYDGLDNLVGVNQGGQTRSFVYDALSRLKSQTTPEGGLVTYSYWDFDSVKKRVDARNVETHYKYDALNRLERVWYTGLGGDDAGTVRPALPAGVEATVDVVIQYNTSAPGNGGVSRVDDGAGYETYGYDSLGRNTSKSRVIDGYTFTTSYEYNQVGQQTAIIYPSQKRVRSNYDARGRFIGLDKMNGTSVALSFVSQVGYNTAGQVTGLSLGNGVVESYGYSQDRLQMTSQTATKSGSTLMSVSYNYTASAGQSGAGTTAGNSGQLMSVTATINSAAKNQAFTYDNVGRLKTAAGWNSTTNRRFDYDRWGNRVGVWNAVSGGTQIQSVTLQQPGGVTNNRIASVGGVNYVYDAVGDVTNDGAHTYQYDAESRMVKVDSGATAINTYDAANRRVKKQTATGTTWYVWEGGQVIAEYGAAQGSGGIRYYHPDRLSTRMITNSTGGVAGTQDQLPFGEDAGVTGESEKHRFTNYERDLESGTDYAVNRQYSMATGRFIQLDRIAGTIIVPQSLNRYTYAFNDPINYIDPDGRFPVWLVLGAIGAVAGAIGNAVGQVINNGGFDNFSWKSVGVAAATGFVAGALAPYTATTYLGAITSGAVSNGVQYVANQYVTGQEFTWTGLGVSVALGSVAGGIAGPVNTNTVFANVPLSFLSDSSKELFRNSNIAYQLSANVSASNVLRNLFGATFSGVDPIATYNRYFPTSQRLGGSGGEINTDDQILPVPRGSGAGGYYFSWGLNVSNLGNLGVITISASGSQSYSGPLTPRW